jgi:hypothetical protein
VGGPSGRPWCIAQYTSFAFNQVLDDHGMLPSIGTVGDAYDTQSRMPILDAVGWV